MESLSASISDAQSSLLGRKRSNVRHWLAGGLLISVILNGMLILYCARLLSFSPIARDRIQQLTSLEREDAKLRAQKASLEITQKSLIEQKEQLLKHYRETEQVGKKLAAYKEKLAADAVEVKNAESNAEQLMSRLANAQGNTIATKLRLKEEKKKLQQARQELDRVLAAEKKLKQQEALIQRSQREDELVKALETDDMNINSTERAHLCQSCTCVKYC
mmetsp:Transcript_79662/g.213380  ORF Transcript_79662/g.213380 Transcript_79662/m.213380 type:complete len:219 (+) Transcript_79662:44-700(+)